MLGALGIERVHLVLHDVGGPWGLAWASRNLRRLASLTLINVEVLPGYSRHKFARLDLRSNNGRIGCALCK